jgi:hypothetical protein
MIFRYRTHTVVALLVVIAVCFSVKAQVPTPNNTEWESEALKLRLFYPSDLVKADTEQVMHGGQSTLSGVSGSADPKLMEMTRCLRPLLVLNLPAGAAVPSSATLLLAELDVECLNGEREGGSTTLLSELAGLVNSAPGMKPIAQPSTYTIGWQKVQMAAAQGQPEGMSSQLYTMALSTNWNNHLLVWYFSSTNIETLNRITKTTVRFGRAQAAPLYPLAIGNTTPQQ